MRNPFKPITTAILPTFEGSDYWLAFKLLLCPSKYLDKKSEENLKEKLKKYFDNSRIFLFESGRTSLTILLKALEFSPESEVLIQAFTCVAVPNSVQWAGLKPVYVDIDETLNLNPDDLEKKITDRAKAVIVQHSFGVPCDINSIRQICEKHNLILIEDLAHSLGNTFGGKKLGTLGNASILSFGRDKVISGICGGAIVTRDEALSKKIEKIASGLPRHTAPWVFKQLLYPTQMFVVLHTYFLFGLGKFIHFVINRLKLAPRVITREEKRGENNAEFFVGLPGALCCIASQQFEKLDVFLAKRKKIAKLYAEELGETFNSSSSYLRYNIFVDKPHSLRKFAGRHGIFLGNWYDQVVAPRDVDLEKVGYVDGSCPLAEEKAKQIVNLPTNPNMSMGDVERVIKVVKEWKRRSVNQ